jgi:hypothetical protein
LKDIPKQKARSEYVEEREREKNAKKHRRRTAKRTCGCGEK